MKIGVLGVYRPQFDQQAAEEASRRVLEAVIEVAQAAVNSKPQWLGMVDEWQAESRLAEMAGRLAENDVIIAVMGTFVGADVVKRVSELAGGALWLWTVTEPRVGQGRLSLNSLCGGLLTNYAFKQSGVSLPMLSGDPDDVLMQKRLRSLLLVEKTHQALRETTIGIVGKHPAGFYPCDYDADQLRQLFGVEIRQIPLQEAFRQSDLSQAEQLDGPYQVVSGLEGWKNVEPAEVQSSLKAELGLRRLIDEYHLTSLTVECWPQYMTEYGGAVCWAMSRLIDDQIMAGCEADVNGTLSMLLCRQLGGQSPFFGDLVHQVQEDRLVFWHCGAAPLSLAGERPRASVHPNRKVGLTLDFALAGGPATVVRLHRDQKGYAIMAIEGDAVQEPLHFSGNTATFRTRRPASKVVEDLLRDGAEHHFSVGYGVEVEDVQSLAVRLGIPVHVY